MQEKEITVKQGIGASSITFFDDKQIVKIKYDLYQDGVSLKRKASFTIPFEELMQSHPEEFAQMSSMMTMLADLKRPSIEE